MMFFSVLLFLSVSARIRQTDKLPLDVEEWMNQDYEGGESIQDWQSSKVETEYEDESDILPPDVEEWVDQINRPQESHSCCHSKAEQVDNEEFGILPDDVAEWVEQINGEDESRDWPSKFANEVDDAQLDILPANVGDMADAVNGQDVEQSSDTKTPSDCSIVVTLWKKMGKETVLDPETVSPTGCCMTSKESDFDHVRCRGDRVIHMYVCFLKLRDWRYNHLQGNLPEEIGMLQNLQELYFSDNDLTGSIPPAISNCKSMLYLYVLLAF